MIRLTSSQEKILIHFEGSLPQNQRAKFRRIVEQRLSGNPTTTVFEAICGTLLSEMARGERHAVRDGRAS
jgi:hypothetical protein